MLLAAFLLAPALAVAPGDDVADARCALIMTARARENRPEEEGLIAVVASYYVGRLAARHETPESLAMLDAAKAALKRLPKPDLEAEADACLDRMLERVEPLGDALEPDR